MKNASARAKTIAIEKTRKRAGRNARIALPEDSSDVFCSNCGSQIPDTAKFCTNCGQPSGGSGAATYYPPAPPVAPLRYDIEGHNLQIARVHLEPGQEIYAEAGKMIYKSANVDWATRMTGQSISQKILGAIKRKLMGESLFFTYFGATDGPGEVGFAGHYPGKIQVFELGAGQLGGEGFILQKLTGPGAVFVHAGGDHVDYTLAPGEVLQVQTGHLVAFEPTVNYDVQLVGNIRTAIFGGEGLFLTTLTGPGRVILQSMTLERLRHELSPAEHSHNGVERNPLEAIARGDVTSFFRSDD